VSRSTSLAGLGILAVAAAAGPAVAGTITPFIGASDAHAGDFVFDPGYAAAKAKFLSSVPGTSAGVDSLEGKDRLGGLPTDLVFGSTGVTGTITASLEEGPWRFEPTVVGTDPEGQAGPLSDGPFSRQATEGEQFLVVGLEPETEAVLDVTFSPEDLVRGFGFSVTDLGDFGATISVSFFDGTVQSLPIAPGSYGLGPGNFENGDHLWVSFATDEAIAGVSIDLIGGTGGDLFSFDEFTVLVVPVPPAAGLAVLGLAAVVWRRRRMLVG